MQVVFRHLAYEPTGFGQAAREIAFALEDLGIDIKLDPIGQRSPTLETTIVQRLQCMEDKPLKNDRLLLTVRTDDFAGDPTPYQKVVSCTMFETSKAPSAFVAGCNRMDALIVPCEMNRQAFTAAGVQVPIYVARYGVNSQLFHPDGPARNLSANHEDFVFLSVFGWSERKAPDILIRAFLNEFQAGEPVRLVIKTHSWQMDFLPPDWFDDIVRQVDKSELPRIQIITEDLSPTAMAMVYRGADCFVLPTRGEGIGLPYLESMATALPVIATGWGGQMEFLDPRCAYLIPYKLVPAHPLWFTDLYQSDQLWAEPDEGSLQNLMRRVYLMRHEARQKGQTGRAIAVQWTWHRTAQQFLESLESIVGHPLK